MDVTTIMRLRTINYKTEQNFALENIGCAIINRKNLREKRLEPDIKINITSEKISGESVIHLCLLLEIQNDLHDLIYVGAVFKAVASV